jgi:hypothetical protein
MFNILFFKMRLCIPDSTQKGDGVRHRQHRHPLQHGGLGPGGETQVQRDLDSDLEASRRRATTGKLTCLSE